MRGIGAQSHPAARSRFAIGFAADLDRPEPAAPRSHKAMARPPSTVASCARIKIQSEIVELCLRQRIAGKGHLEAPVRSSAAGLTGSTWHQVFRPADADFRVHHGPRHHHALGHRRHHLVEETPGAKTLQGASRRGGGGCRGLTKTAKHTSFSCDRIIPTSHKMYENL
jgi:hypothetical protein